MFVPIFNLSICYLYLFIIQTISSSSSSPCIYDLGNKQQLDIRTLGNGKGKGPKYDNIDNSIPVPVPVTFSWNGCYDYSKSDGGTCADAAACSTNMKYDESTIIAKHSEAKFEHIHDTQNVLYYDHEDLQLTVVLTCEDIDQDIAIGRQDDPKIFHIEIKSRCCCPGKCKYSDGSMSGGSIFIIILIVILFVYIIVGAGYLRFSRGATGQDLIPNRLLWLSILSYAINGLRYSIQVIRNRSLDVDYQKV